MADGIVIVYNDTLGNAKLTGFRFRHHSYLRRSDNAKDIPPCDETGKKWTYEYVVRLLPSRWFDSDAASAEPPTWDETFVSRDAILTVGCLIFRKTFYGR
jgi:hypothetical protein